jgi:hypothetical protein
MHRTYSNNIYKVIILRGLSTSTRSGGAISGTECMVPEPFATGGNWSYLELWAVTSGSRYVGYKTLTVALEPSVEQAAEPILSMRA